MYQIELTKGPKEKNLNQEFYIQLNCHSDAKDYIEGLTLVQKDTF